MGNPANKGVPDALKTTKVVTLFDGTEVRVLRWSFTKFLEIADKLDGWLGDVPDSTMDRILKGNARNAVFGFVQLIGKHTLELLRSSIEDPKQIGDDMSAEDVIVIMEAVMDLNLTEQLLKKGGALWARSQRMLGAQS